MSFRIEEWQVMQAWRNGARIASTSRVHPNWVYTENPEWNWKDNDYRIADLTSDGIRLDELVEAYPMVVTLQEDITYDEHYRVHAGEVQTLALTGILCENPELIGKVKVQPKEKKLRPWTMEEFEKHRDEWFTRISNGWKCRVTAYVGGSICFDDRKDLTLIDLLNEYTGDGCPCGVLE
jgi:hypothetical protein